MKKIAFLILLLALPKPPLDAAIATQSLNYQGQLTDLADVAVTGTAQMAFVLYPTLTGGTALWSQVASSVPVTRGLFNVDLDVSSLAAVPGALNGTLYLEVTVNGQVLSPRKQVLASAFALNSDHLQGYEAGNGPNKVPVLDSSGRLDPSVVSAPFPLLVSGSAGGSLSAANIYNADPAAGEVGLRAVGAFAALSGSASAATGAGVLGYTAAIDTAAATGVWGAASNGVGVRAWSGAAGTSALQAINPLGLAIYGNGPVGAQFSASQLGLRIGGVGLGGQIGQTPVTGIEVNSTLQGIVISNAGANAGLSAVGTGSGPGVEGVAMSANAVGVRGAHTGSGYGTGVWGLSSAPGGTGVHAENTNLTGTGAALLAVVSSPSGAAVDAQSPALGIRALASAVSGQTFGVRSQADATDGQALRGDAGGSGAAFGAYAVAPNSVNGAGVYGLSSAHGVWGQSSGANFFGVYGLAPGVAVRGDSTGNAASARGVYGSTHSQTGTGVYGESLAGTAGSAFGVQGFAVDGGGTGVYGQGAARGVAGMATGGQGHGVEGDAGPAGNGDGRAGVYGVALAGTDELVYGVYTSVSGPSASAYGLRSQAHTSQGKAAQVVNYASQASSPGYALDIEGKFRVGTDNSKYFIGPPTAQTTWQVTCLYCGIGDLVQVTPQMDITNGGTVANSFWVGPGDVGDGYFIVNTAAPVANMRFQYLVIDK